MIDQFILHAVCIICWKDKPDSIKFFVSLTATVIALKVGWLKELSLQLMEGNADQAHPLVITHFNPRVAISMAVPAINMADGCQKIIATGRGQRLMGVTLSQDYIIASSLAQLSLLVMV